ncbi:MAG TPA: amidase family protein, partial [Streptosporangiaceae bacterium]
ISGGPLVPDLTGLVTDGPLTRSVADAALLLDVMTGNQPGDMYTQPPLPAGETFLGCASRPPGRLRIARTLQHPIEGAAVHPDCVAAYEDASRLLASLGHEIEDIALPLGEDIVPFFEIIYYAYATLTPVDPSQEHVLLPLTRYLRERGRAIAAPDFIFAQAYMQFVVRIAVATLGAYDAILTPTLATPPVPVGYFDEVDPAENFERQKRFTPFTAIYNTSGLPAVSVPLHWTAEGLPIGVMLAGRMGDEATLISLSAQLEEARPWKDRHPPLW